MRWIAIVALLVATAPQDAWAQDRDQTLADIRQELSVLYVDLQRLKRELNTTGAPTAASGGTLLQRANAIETQMQRLTAKTEELEFRINRIATDGGNRVGDLEFRLCELESGCDIATLAEGSTLGGDVDVAAPAPDAGIVEGPELAIGEEADFERADAALNAGSYAEALGLLETFLTTYPGSPLAPLAHLMRGDALAGGGDQTASARAYLEAFSAAPDGDSAPEALYKLGYSLGQLGQTAEACVTLAEVGVRFPGSDSVTAAEAERSRLACS
ncbi:tol-pal system protein YbgF [Thalassobius sp. Cn5-15]|uniref:tol-pal system protein YbgF n=1 Tax=Thalassobius sp. Cn5-15 TaxID=2917763 RepID=UPI001EF35EB6|nr:tol-pal system protein YbgF [Thalassobius sp. Cn5-15]MCG7493211.1 tol-pal system protein YbgF [Thalassobius sp. Cn5-15]